MGVQVSPHTPIRKVRAAYAKQRDIDVEQVRLIYHGSRLVDEHTPRGVGMEDTNDIDAMLVGAFAFQYVHTRLRAHALVQS